MQGSSAARPRHLSVPDNFLEMSFQVQFITHFTETLSYLDSVRIAIEGGCRWIQLRMKDAPEDEVRAAAGKALPLCRQYGAVLILDDRVELVRECGADGVHLADYIGCGPFRFTTTKDPARLAPTLGLEGYRSLMDGMRREGLALPVVGIGGVTAEDMPALAEAGLSGIALSGSILRAEDPVAEMRRVMQIAASIALE